MDCKLTVTTDCGAKCKTCPVWTKPKETMEFGDFQHVWTKLNKSPLITKIIVNNTGDLYQLPNRIKYLTEMEKRNQWVCLQTNANVLDYIPSVDQLVISFNGGNKEAYEYTTGLSFEKVCGNIRRAYNALPHTHAEIHMLVWEGNKDSVEDFKKLWADFPGRVRLSYKYDNQMKKDYTLKEYQTKERIPCDYLKTLNVMPDGSCIMCAHDFDKQNVWGNVFDKSIQNIVYSDFLAKKQKEHNQGEYTGLCEKCNYNEPLNDRIVYVKG